MRQYERELEDDEHLFEYDSSDDQYVEHVP
jgi:hypothetical protein